MADFPGDPLDYPAGTLFSYAVWDQNTKITLHNVPWNNDYRDVLSPQMVSNIDTYLDTRPNTVASTNARYARPDQPIRLNIPFNKAAQYNYVRVVNPSQPVPGNDFVKAYYYFITGVNYVAPNTTELILQLDVWTTYITRVTFGNSYIERGHIGIANQHANDNYGRDYLTVPEGFDTGAEYNVKSVNTVITSPSILNYSYPVLIASTVDLEADYGSVGASGSTPRLTTATGSAFAGITSALSFYLVKAGDLPDMMSALSEYPWVSEGIQSMTALPFSEAFLPLWESGEKITGTLGPWLYRADASALVSVYNANGYTAFRQFMGTDNDSFLPERYRKLSKFRTSPYTMLELTTFSGNPLMLKPESWADDDLRVRVVMNPIPPEQKVMVYPFRYNAHPDTTAPDALSNLDDMGEYLDLFTSMQGFPQFAIVNNLALMFQASNANQLNWQRESADWSQQRALGSNQVAYDQASAGMDLANTQTNLGVAARNQTTKLQNQMTTFQAVTGGIGAVAGGIGTGGVGLAAGAGQAAMGALNAAVQENMNNQMTGVQNNLAIQQNAASVGTSGYIRDTNKSLADWAANGDYSNSIAAINAKVQDSLLTQPSVSGQVGGELLKLILKNWQISLRVKMIDDAHIAMIGDYWLRYGYAVNRFSKLPASLMVMDKATYWKVRECYITGQTIPENFRQAIRGTLEKGVTVWANPDDIGNIDFADNNALGGVTL